MKKKQTDMILEYMKEHGSITPLDALMKFHCMRLGARIHDLKAEGHIIRTDRETHKTQDGRTSRYARYTLIQ